jgi:sulfur-carrier protein adenylyltransferase/sulfurtransferase
MLKSKGFEKVLNLSGGIKAWNGTVALGAEDLGLDLFAGTESQETFLVVAYSLEMGLQDFYLSMMTQVSTENAKDLFRKLADIEIIHRQRILKSYIVLTGRETTAAEFEKSEVTPMIEGGLSTEEYLRRFNIDFESTMEITSMAMSIEAQALDLYQRLVGRAEDAGVKATAIQIAEEERAHLAQLAKLMDTLDV